MSKPLTIKQLKALEVGDWVWVKFVIENSIDKKYENQEKYFQIIEPENDTAIRFNRFVPMPYSDYGTMWLVYKNKEQAEGEYDRQVEGAKKQVAKEILQLIDKNTFNIGKAIYDQTIDESANTVSLCGIKYAIHEKYNVEVDE